MRRRGVRGLVLAELRGEVDVGEHVPVEDEEAVGEQLLGELDRAGRAQRRGLLDVAEPHAVGAAVAHDVAHAAARKPQDITTSSIPWPRSHSTMNAMKGRSTSGTPAWGPSM